MKWILVAGCGHTGTTITAKIIGLNSCVYGFEKETNFLRLRRLHRVKQIKKAFSVKARARGKEFICEKTPKHIERIDFARRILPDPFFVLCTRNPYDAIASLAARESPRINNEVIKIGFKRYLDDNLALVEQIQQPDVLVHRYENFVQDPQASIRSIRAHVKMDFEERMLKPDEVSTRWFQQTGKKNATRLRGRRNGHASRRSWQVNQKIFDNRGKWREMLNADQLEYLNGLLSSPISLWMLKKLDYNLES